MVTSWLEIPDQSDFPVTNLPYGVISYVDTPRQVATAIGQYVLPLAAGVDAGLFDGVVDRPADLLGARTLNPLMAAGPAPGAPCATG